MPGFLALGVWVLSPILVGTLPVPAQAAPQSPATEHCAASSFRAVLDPGAQPTPYSGRVQLLLSRDPDREPRASMGDWFGDVQIFAFDAVRVAPGAPIDLSDAQAEWPRPFSDLSPGEYRVQAVARRSLDSPDPGFGPGDLYSEVVTVSVSHDSTAAPADLTLNRVAESRRFVETDRVKLVSIISPSLSEFAGREVRVSAGVVLPERWKDDPARRYPTLVWIGGFSSTHHAAHSEVRLIAPPPGAPDVLIVVPDPSCHFGHSVFADSANNGPRGRALVDELIPEVERRFHGANSGEHRFVTGVSSGGWSSLWLQVAYPDRFNGAWAHCPDPVDFRDFQRTDLYKPGSNMYRDERGERRPIARRQGRVVLWYDDFTRREDAVGDGGQIRSFEAVFSPRGPDGRPMPLFDRTTGAVNAATARAWEPYDIRLVLERNWKELGPKLAGKIHVYAGGEDTFYLEGAAAKLKDSLQTLGSDAVVEIVPGQPHTVIPQGVQGMWSGIKSRCP